jgi:hypothetical protein
MLKKLHFDFRDVLRAPRLGFSAKKVWVQFQGLVVGLFGYAVLAYVALLIEGFTLGEIWTAFGALPLPICCGLHWYGWVIFALGGLWALVICLMAGTATSKLTYEQLRGNDFYSKKEAWRFARKHAPAVILSPVGMAIVVAILIGGGLLIGLIAGTGAVGAWLTSAFYPVIMAITIFTVYLVLIVLVGLIISPAVVATTKNDTFETIFELFSTVSAQPWRLVLYNILLGIAMAIAGLILIIFIVLALKLMQTVFGLAWGSDFTGYVFPQAGAYTFAFLKTPASILQANTMNCVAQISLESGLPMSEIIYTVPGLNWIAWLGLPPLAVQPSAGLQVAAIIYTVWTVVLLGLIVSYYFSTFYVGQTLIYIALRKKKDDENLLERKDYEEEFPEFEVPEENEDTADGTESEAPEEAADEAPDEPSGDDD